MKVLGICAAAMALALAGGARAEDTMTVQSLVGQGFQIVGAIPTQAGPGVFLQNKDKAVFCVVVETPTSSDVGTRYCKPVH